MSVLVKRSAKGNESGGISPALAMGHEADLAMGWQAQYRFQNRWYGVDSNKGDGHDHG